MAEIDVCAVAEEAIKLFVEDLERRNGGGLGHDDDGAPSQEMIEQARVAAVEAIAGRSAPSSGEVEQRPFIIGESVYIAHRGQEPGTVCAVTRVYRDHGGEFVETINGPVRADCLRRDRRGRKLPVYNERPLTAEEQRRLRERR